MPMKIRGYRVVVSLKRGYAVIDQNKVTEYDNLESYTDARAICGALNEGLGPDWDAIESRVQELTQQLNQG